MYPDSEGGGLLDSLPLTYENAFKIYNDILDILAFTGNFERCIRVGEISFAFPSNLVMCMFFYFHKYIHPEFFSFMQK